ncbi:cytochrome c [Salinisphaera sp. T5B8]|uniref:c-type cytochrome n=1 Tax=Salinisphaera sp. T5B8 TaxID=1304154 RepID=UPI00333ECEED
MAIIKRTFWALALLMPAAALAQSPAADIAQQGVGNTVPPCSSCHGPDGQGNAAAGFPRLAGLGSVYLQDQLDAYADGRRENAIMQPIASALSAAQRRAMANYYSALAFKPSETNAPQQPISAAAVELAEHGRWDDAIPACVQCHGPGGMGIGDRFPALAGQSANYIASQLRAWRAHKRPAGPMDLMATIANRLDAADIMPVAEYFAAQPSTTAPATNKADDKANDSSTGPAKPAGTPNASGVQASTFVPPARGTIPDNEFGAMVRKGRAIFTDTQQHAARFVGNDLQCANCHLDEGRLADSSPLWAAWAMYPAYRGKNKHVNDFPERIQGCFRYSMNGTPPPRGDEVLLALETYAYWLASGAPVGKALSGRGYPELDAPRQSPSFERGAQVYTERCALCHGSDGQGQRAADGRIAFPPLWGPRSYNWGAGMHRVNTAAAFIKANMPLGATTLSEQQAWDVAQFIDSHERPQDPRFTGSVADTAKQYHGKYSMYGQTVNGEVLGQNAPPSGTAPAAKTR